MYSYYMPNYEYETHIVQKGDSLWKIAKDHGVSVESIMVANNLNSDLIYPNQVLYIPKARKNSYTTVEGDTLGKLFNVLNLDSKCLGKYSPLFDVLLVPNQEIELVEAKTKSRKVSYQGESIDEFLKKHDISAQKLLELNGWLSNSNDVIIS